MSKNIFIILLPFILLICNFANANELNLVAKIATQKSKVDQKKKKKLKKDIHSIHSNEQNPVRTLNVVGAGVGTFTGFGLGHIFQSRYSDMGWIFTTTQVAGAIMMIAGGVYGDCARGEDCGNREFGTLGALTYFGSRVWEIYDLWTHLRPEKKPALTLNLLPAKEIQTPLLTLNYNF